MKNRVTLRRFLLFTGVLALLMSPAYGDPACDAEVVAIQAELDAPASDISPSDLAEATRLFKVLSEDCDGGTTLEVAAPIAQQIRSLLGMGES